MNCKNAQEIILEQFPDLSFNEVLNSHINQCDDCAQLVTELRIAVETVGTDEDFRFAESELENAVQNVIQTIPASHTTKVTRLFPRIATVAASLFIVFGAGWVVKEMTNSDPAFNGVESLLSDSSVKHGLSVTAGAEDEPMELLYGDLADNLYQNSMEELANDITDEEFEYLESNFDVGDLL